MCVTVSHKFLKVWCNVSNIIKEYQDRLREIPYVPKTSFRRDLLGYCGNANKLFLIEPGTTLSSDCWAAYQDIGLHGYTHRTVNYSISFVNPGTGDHTNTLECTWPHVKAFLLPYNRQEDYEFHLALYVYVCAEVQDNGGFSVHSIPCNRRIYRLILLYQHSHLSVRRHVTYSCLSPGDSDISLPGKRAHSTCTALFPRCLLPVNIEDMALERMTAPIAAILIVPI